MIDLSPTMHLLGICDVSARAAEIGTHLRAAFAARNPDASFAAILADLTTADVDDSHPDSKEAR